MLKYYSFFEFIQVVIYSINLFFKNIEILFLLIILILY